MQMGANTSTRGHDVAVITPHIRRWKVACSYDTASGKDRRGGTECKGSARLHSLLLLRILAGRFKLLNDGVGRATGSGHVAVQRLQDVLVWQPVCRRDAERSVRSPPARSSSACPLACTQHLRCSRNPHKRRQAARAGNENVAKRRQGTHSCMRRQQRGPVTFANAS